MREWYEPLHAHQTSISFLFKKCAHVILSERVARAKDPAQVDAVTKAAPFIP